MSNTHKHSKLSLCKGRIERHFVFWEMKRFLLRLLGFTCLATCGYFPLLFFFGCHIPRSPNINLLFTFLEGYTETHLTLQDAMRAGDVDLLVLGSSHALRGYDPRIFRSANIRTFSLGTTSQTPLQTEMLVNKYLDTLHPRRILVDVAPWLFAKDGVESAVDIVQNTAMDRNMVRMAFQIDNLRLYNSMIYFELRQFLGMNKRIPAVRADTVGRYIGYGYVETTRPFLHVSSLTRTRDIISPAQRGAFDRILSVFKTRGIPYVLVQAPITRDFYDKSINMDEIDSFFASRGTYYNFNKLLHLPDSMFFDDVHLNQKGVEVFDKKLLQVVYHRENKSGGKL